MELRPYQEKSKEKLREGFRNWHTRQILCASTGAGKSIIAVSMLQDALKKNARVLFIVERRILAEQFSEHLDRAGVPHGLYMAKHWRWRPNERVQIASAQTLERMDCFPEFDLCIIDEVHACCRKSILNMLTVRDKMKTIGLTATPFNPKLALHFSSIVNVVTMRELVDEGHLVPFRVFAAKEINTEGLKTDFTGEFEKKGMETRARQIVGDVVSDYIRINTQVYGELRKAIVFSSGIAHGSELMQLANAAGVNAVQISSEDSDEFKRGVIEEFKKPDTEIKWVISSELLERGFDMGDVYTVILAKAIKKSFSKFVQMIGRGARPYPEKELCTLIDHGSNWLRFDEQWRELYGNGVSELTSAPDTTEKKEPSQKEKEAAKCPRCGLISGGNPCRGCGFERPAKNEVITLPGEMFELTGDMPKREKFTSEYKESFYQGLLFYARQKGYSDGYAWHKYQEKFDGLKPAWKKIASPPNAEVTGFLQHLAIKNRYSKK